MTLIDLDQEELDWFIDVLEEELYYWKDDMDEIKLDKEELEALTFYKRLLEKLTRPLN